MALFKDGQFVQTSSDSIFDRCLMPGETAPCSGIYRCETCGHETVVRGGEALPAKAHHLHLNETRPILWRLVVFAEPV